MKKGIRAYNLYPKLVGSMDSWIEHFDRIQAMNFDWIYINPINYPGFSGSDYAVKDYYYYHPLYVTGKMDFENPEANVKKGNQLLKKVCWEADKRGMKIMMDLVINHTAFDSPLSIEHPDWYEHDVDGQLIHPGALDGDKWIAWKDLAQIDNAHSSDRDNLWNYWLDMMLFYMDLGIRGFRCDAAYHVPTELWYFLIPRIKEKYPDAIFLGETLGCLPEQVVDIAAAGFDFITNSFKWWDLQQQWFLDQTQEYSRYAPSIAFPENHDTIRCAEEFNGNQHQALLRYELAAYICSSISTTIGFEYGFQRQIHVVETTPSWWEPAHYDISDEIAKINKIKASYDVLQEDNKIEMLQLHNASLFGFTKESRNGKEKMMLVANINSHETAVVHGLHMHGIMGSNKVQDISRCHQMEEVPAFLEYHLHPGEVKLFYVKR
ncbi:MAG: alpha-amylase family glycosyl hydrolase [Psychromonas sp.]